MKIEKKTINTVLLGYISAQFLGAGAGASLYHLSHQKTQVPNKEETAIVRYSPQDILYGVITKPPLHPTESPYGETKEFKAYFIGTTTGTNTSFIVIPA